MENGNINIEEIMAEIKRGIKEQGLTADMLSFEDVPFKKTAQGGSASEALDYITSHYYIQPYKELKGNPVKVFIKKVIRKLVKFYVEPVVFEQNDFNANAVTVMKSLSEGQAADLSGKVETLELAQKELLIRLDKLERENKELRTKLSGENS
ncbi:hypothetical protein [Ruminococcus flavefaciens]|uniref:hypothetical protein n=1 Tax=Ruminococcus flavefaciens TaxID=1265 RepID=UPI0026E9E35F|nr:hypothetical protein [Ruminococcus flavefaciens]MDD7517333.1 hypothetical protein [Ruminococcus flavefaciens]MDY5690864.1 hypothetical protein [Ruminococcus flavefaciens]